MYDTVRKGINGKEDFLLNFLTIRRNAEYPDAIRNAAIRTDKMFQNPIIPPIISISILSPYPKASPVILLIIRTLPLMMIATVRCFLFGHWKIAKI